jgi:hypothetical protein
VFVGQKLSCDQQAIDLPLRGIQSCETSGDLRSGKRRGRRSATSAGSAMCSLHHVPSPEIGLAQ